MRGPFGSISTSLPGVHFCEYLPRMAQWMDRSTLIRSATHDQNDHSAGMLYTMTGAPADKLESLVPVLRKHAIESVAIAFLQSFTNAAHEQQAREVLTRAMPELWVTLSSDVCPEIREYERISTTCANAYVQPVMAGYLNRLNERLRDMGIQIGRAHV